MNEHDISEQAYKNGYEKGYEDGKRDAVKQGRWLTDRFGLERSICSVCDACYEGDGGNYCPNCGARMEGDWNG